MNIPNTDINIDLGDLAVQFGKFVGEFYDLGKLLGRIPGLGGIFGGNNDDEIEKRRQDTRDRADTMRADLNGFMDEMNKSDFGKGFLAEQDDALNKYKVNINYKKRFGNWMSGYYYRRYNYNKTFTINEMLSGAAAGWVNDLPYISNDEAFNWWRGQFEGVSNVLADIRKDLDPYTYRYSQTLFEGAHPDTDMPYSEFLMRTETTHAIEQNISELKAAGFNPADLTDEKIYDPGTGEELLTSEEIKQERIKRIEDQEKEIAEYEQEIIDQLFALDREAKKLEHASPTLSVVQEKIDIEKKRLEVLLNQTEGDSTALAESIPNIDSEINHDREILDGVGKNEGLTHEELMLKLDREAQAKLRLTSNEIKKKAVNYMTEFYVDTTRKFSDMNEQLDSMTFKIEGLEGDIGELEGDVGELEGDVEKLESDIVDKDTEISNITDELATTISELVNMTDDYNKKTNAFEVGKLTNRFENVFKSLDETNKKIEKDSQSKIEDVLREYGNAKELQKKGFEFDALSWQLRQQQYDYNSPQKEQAPPETQEAAPSRQIGSALQQPPGHIGDVYFVDTVRKKLHARNEEDQSTIGNVFIT